jgi:hypothetical protein
VDDYGFSESGAGTGRDDAVAPIAGWDAVAPIAGWIDATG